MINEAMACPECSGDALVIDQPNSMWCPNCRAAWGVVRDPDTGNWCWGRHPNRRGLTVVGEVIVGDTIKGIEP